MTRADEVLAGGRKGSGQPSGEITRPRGIPASSAPLNRLQIIVPGRPPNLANARLHFRAKSRLVAERKQLLRNLTASARALARQKVATEPRKATAALYLAGRLFDRDNAYAALKADLDGIVAGGGLVDDSPDWCQLDLMQVTETRARQRVAWELSW